MCIRDRLCAYTKMYWPSYRKKPKKVIFTIHNLAYQGIGSSELFKIVNLPGHFFTHDYLEFYGNLNLLKAGLVFSDVITTAVSYTHLDVYKRQEKGHDPKTAAEIFDLIEYFAGYGFNKSHSAAYAFISYQTAYLKAHYPTEYLTACLTSIQEDTDKIAKFIMEARRLSIKILPPDVNESLANFTVVGEKKIRFGLAAIKNVGENAVNEILTRRKEARFQNIFDLSLIHI